MGCGGSRGAVAPKQNLGGGGRYVSVPKISLGQHKIGLTRCSENCAAGKTAGYKRTGTICEAFNKSPVTKTLLGEVHKLWLRQLQRVHFLPYDDSRTT